MESSFDRRAVQCYSNFMKYTISNSIYNLLLILIENSTILFVIDLMLNDKLLGEALTPFYFLSPHLYLDMINEHFDNQCNKIFFVNLTKLKEEEEQNSGRILRNLANNEYYQNLTHQNMNFKNYYYNNQTKSYKRYLDIENDSNEIVQNIPDMYKYFNDNKPKTDIVFFGHHLYSTDNSYCIYSEYLVIIVICIIIFATICFILLCFLNMRNKPNLFKKILCIILVNVVHLVVRPFFIVISIVLMNRPILFLYKGSNIKEDYNSIEIIYLLLSLIFLVYAGTFSYIVMSYINNIFYFEKMPYDYFGITESLLLMGLKLMIGFKITFDKINGLNFLSALNLVIGLLLYVRAYIVYGSRGYKVNHVYLKNFSAFLSFFFCFYIGLKLLNAYLKHLKFYSSLNLSMEIVLIIGVIIILLLLLFNDNDKFDFKTKEEFISESMDFMYYISRNLNLTSNLKEKKDKREDFFDSVIIGHKMKCKMEDCIICCEDIYNPDMKTLCLILYQQFLQNEKEYKESNEELTILVKLMYLKMIDENKIHRISFTILKNLKNKNLSFGTLLKINYMYIDNLDELNRDLKGLLTIKYGEMNTELLTCVKYFEEILGFIKTRTEKIELVTDKTNLLGKMYKEIVNDLYYLKSNKKIHFEPPNFLQLICIVRLIFPRMLDSQLTDGIEYSFVEFLETLDKLFASNMSILVRYDFNNRTWRIKKIPKKFIDTTGFKISELLDQSLEKIFPKNLAKSRIKKLEEEIILSNVTDSKLEFKTVICDSETNARYVKFEVNIIPHLENSYMIFMECHFHKRQLLIIDEFGNFVNGSAILYEKVGINADIVAASKGIINMFTMFNLDKKQKLEDIKIVSIAKEGVVDATKNLFLLENEQGKPKQTTMPNFLDSFIKNEASGGTKKDKSVVFLHLFMKEVINDVKYYIYNIKISNPEEKKKKHTTEGSEDDNKSGHDNKHSVTIKHLNTSYSNSSDEKEAINKEEKSKDKKDDKKEEDINNYQNYVNYYNTFYESQNSMSMTMNYKTNVESYNSSQTNSVNSDVFGYLYMKSISSQSHSNKFENFIYGIFLFNIVLLLYGLCSIIYVKTYSNNSLDIIDVLERFYTMTSRIYKSTNNFFCFIKYYKDNNDKYNHPYDNYINSELGITDIIEYDKIIKYYLNYDSTKTLNDIIDFNTLAFNRLGTDKYNDHLNYQANFVHLEPSGSYSVKLEKMKSIIDLFTLTINQLANRVEIKIFLNISYLEYEYDNLNSSKYSDWMHLKGINISLLTNDDKNYFTEYINVYQHFFNYFNSFILNFQKMTNYLNDITKSHFNTLHNTGKSLLIVILILNIIFVLICFSSIIIYKKILMKEFRSLYGLSEDSINNLKEKYQYVKELIKSEQLPSKIYDKIKKMRESIEEQQFEEKQKKKKQQKMEKIAENQKKLIEKSKTANNQDDTMSVLTTGSTGRTNDYLKFSGAVKGLFRSSTIRAQEQMKKLTKESSKQKASEDLLKRLNFDFEMIHSFIFFIAFMSLFYLIIGITVIIVSDDKYDNLKTSLEFTKKFQNKFFYLLNFYSGTKLSIMFNKKSPFTVVSDNYYPDCEKCLYNYLFNYSSISAELTNIEVNHNKFKSVNTFDLLLQSEYICETFYNTYKSSFSLFLEEQDSNITNKLSTLCAGIPILKSNVDSIYTFIMVYTRKMLSQYSSSNDKSLTKRIDYLTNKFLETDIIMNLFVNFYYEYVYENTVSKLNKNITKAYYSFMVIIFVINIFVDLFMIFFIWFKIYIQIIYSVNNIQLATDSVSIV